MSPPDSIAVPYDLRAGYGADHRRVLVLGGGGIFFIAWQVAYLHRLAKRGIDFGAATRVVGTSAGSVVASLVTSGRIELARAELGLLAKLPNMVAAMAPTDSLRPSQLRALELFRQASDARPETIQAIGRAALAADADPAPKLRRSIAAVLAKREWPSDALTIATVDTYTGERLVLTADAGCSPARAAAASSSVPGLFSPQLVSDRKCMDGGVSGSGTHADLAVGAERVVILSLSAQLRAPQAMMTIHPDSLDTETQAIRDAGGDVFLRGPREAQVDTLMSPDSIPEAVAMGADQADSDAEAAAEFWR